MEGRTGGFGSVKNKRGKFNLIDLIFILFFVLAVALIVWILAPFSGGNSAEGERAVMLEYTLEFDSVSAELTDNVSLGDEALGARDQTALGRVNSIRNDILHAELHYDPETDTASMKEYPDCFDLQVTLTAEAIFTPGSGYTVMGQRIAVGGSYSVMFPNFMGNGSCIGMREVG